MTKPKCDLSDVPGGVQDHHRGRMTDHMSAGPQRGHLLNEEGADLVDCRRPPQVQAKAHTMQRPKVQLVLLLS